ncbi:MAG: hypothetical protein AB2L20_28025 [Mangrovibacterium sp.]
MKVISSAQSGNNMKKSPKLERNKQTDIQSTKNTSFIVTGEEHLEPDEDLANAITAEELLKRIVPRLEKSGLK